MIAANRAVEWHVQNLGGVQGSLLVSGVAGKRIRVLFLSARSHENTTSRYSFLQYTPTLEFGRVICSAALGEQTMIPASGRGVLLSEGQALVAWWGAGNPGWLCANGIYRMEDAA